MKKSDILLPVFFTVCLAISIIGYLRRYFSDYNYPPLNNIVRYAALAVISALFLCYILLIREQGGSPKSRSGVRFYIYIALIGLCLSSIYPIFSIDLYEYIIRGRILAVYNSNPYLHAPIEFKNDLFYSIPYAKIFWKTSTMIYGPLWTCLISFISLLAQESIFKALFSAKLMLFIFHAVTSFIIYKLANIMNISDGKLIARAYLFNPFILIVAVLDGHLDTAMICFLAASLAALFRSRFYLAAFFIALSFLIKYLPAMFIPFYVIYMYSATGDKKEFIKKLVICALVFLSTVALFYAPFWAGPKIFSELKVVTVMLDSCTFPYIYSKIASALVPGMTPAFFRYACYALFTFGYFYLLVLFAQAAKKKERLILSMFSVFSLYILIGAFQLNAWHIVWVIPFILLSNMPARYELMLLLSFAAAISFWKRISFLLIAALLVYAFIVLISRKKGEPNAFSA